MYQRSLLLVFSTLILVACEPAPIDTVDSLASDPVRLKEVQQACREARNQVGEETCRRAAEAVNRRFFGDWETPYTPLE